MKVPTRINPQTSPALALVDYQSAPQTHGLETLGQEVQGLGEQLYQKQVARQEFDLNKELVSETNRMQTNFNQLASQQELGADGFAKNSNELFQSEHEKLLESYKEQKYNVKALRNFDLQLSSLRQTFYGKALEFQHKSYLGKVDKDLDGHEVELSQYAASNPDGITSALAQFQTSIDLLRKSGDLTAEEAEARFERGKAVIVNGAGQGLVNYNPTSIIKALDPKFLEKTDAQLGGLPQSTNPWANVAVNVANKFGLDPVDVASVMSYETAGTFSPTIMGGKGGNYMGLIQFGKAERAKYKIDEKSTPDDWTTAISSYLTDRGFKKGMGLEDFYSTINAGKPGRPNASDGKKTVRQHVADLANHVGKAREWLGELSAPDQFADLPLERIGPTPTNIAEHRLTSEPGKISQKKTGIPALDLMDGPQQMQLLAQAKSQMNKNDTELKSALANQHENMITAYKVDGEYAGQVTPEATLKAAFGETRGGQMYAEGVAAQKAGQFVKSIKTLSLPQVAANLAALKPTDTTSPTYQVDAQAWAAASQAAEANQREREADPSSYIMRNFPAVKTALTTAKTGDERKAGYAQMAGAYRQLGIPQSQWLPYSKEQVAQVAQAYDSLPPQQRLAQLKAWGDEMGPSGMAQPFLVQMNGHDGRGPGFDIFMYQQLVAHPNRTAIMVDIMQGQDIFRADPATKPSPGEIKQHFVDVVGTAANRLNPEASRIYYEQAAAIYAARGGKTGNINGVDQFQKNQALYADSLREAVGGIQGNPDSGIVSLHGSGQPATILPVAVTKQQWNSWLQRLTPRGVSLLSSTGDLPITASGHAVSLEAMIDRGVFVMTAPGQYNIISPDDNLPLLNKKGAPFVIRVNSATVKR